MTDKEIAKNFAENLKDGRNLKRQTLKVFGDACGVSGASIGYYENMQRFPTLDTAVRIAEYLGVSLDEMVKENSVMKQRRIAMAKEAREKVEEAIKTADDETIIRMCDSINSRGKNA